MTSHDIAAQIGHWLADGMERGDPLAIASAVILVPIGAIFGSTIL